MRQELLKIQAHFSIPVILITHDPEDVAALAEPWWSTSMAGLAK